MNENFQTEKLSEFFQPEYFSVRNLTSSENFSVRKFCFFGILWEEALDDLEVYKSDIELLEVQFTWLSFKQEDEKAGKNWLRMGIDFLLFYILFQAKNLIMPFFRTYSY